MGIQLKQIAITTTVLASTLLAVAPAALAQDTVTIPEAYTDLFSTYSGDFFSNRTLTSQGNFILGLGGFPEQRIQWDGNAIATTTRNLFDLQTTLDPTLRVPDLTNPYSTSLLLVPSYQNSGVSAGSQFIYETSPMR